MAARQSPAVWSLEWATAQAKRHSRTHTRELGKNAADFLVYRMNTGEYTYGTEPREDYDSESIRRFAALSTVVSRVRAGMVVA